MPRPQFLPQDHTLPRAREARPVGLNFDTVFHGSREHSKTEGLARLLMPKAWERVERLRSMKRARILRERAEKDAAEAAAGQARADRGRKRPVERPATPSINTTNVDDIRNAVDTATVDSNNIASPPPAAPPLQPPSALPPSDSGATVHTAPPAAPPLQPPSAPPLSDSGATVHTAPPAAQKRVRFDVGAATGANAHRPNAISGA